MERPEIKTQKTETVRITIMIASDKHDVLSEQAERRGITLPTYCRLLLSEWANVPEKEAA